jgi:hypothetical protein
VDDDRYVERGQYEKEIALLNAEIKILIYEVKELQEQVKANENEHKEFFKSVIRALLGIIGAIATGFSALVLGGKI